MNGIEALKEICSNCERAGAKNKTLCPFRSISSDYCEAYEQIERELKVLQILKEKKVNIDYVNQFTVNDIEFIRDRYNKQCFYNLTLEETKLIVEWLKNRGEL